VSSQNDRVQAVLEGRPNEWLSIQEIHAKAGTMRLNSRISDLRLKRGLNIEYRVVDGLHCYRLLDGPPVFSSPGTDGGPSSSTISETAGGDEFAETAGPVLAPHAGSPQNEPVRQLHIWEQAA
jgi:hypothetical protein